MRPIPFLLSAMLATGALAQDHLFTFRGQVTGDRLGFAVAGVGDVDRDGWADVAVGAPGHDGSGRDAGEVLVYSGKDGSLLYALQGLAADDQLGWSVAAAGDINRDGVPDLVAGAPFSDAGGVNSGRARVYSGKDGSLLLDLKGGGAREIFGISVSGAGDVDGDGFDDVIVGAHGDNNRGSNTGSARVFSGKDGRLLHFFDGDGAFDFFGHSVSGAGDVDGDGFDDVVVGAPDDDNLGPQSGMARVYSGKTGKVLYTWNGDRFDDFFGHSVAAAGDVDMDGTPDVLVGAPQFFRSQPGTGYLRVFSGKTGKPLYTVAGDRGGDFFGEPVRGAGDIDGDGRADFITGAHRADVNGVDSGYARLYSGRTGTPLFTWQGERAGAQLGYFVGGAGDADRNGTPDLVVGAPEDAPGGTRTGTARIYSGRKLSLFTDVHRVSIASGGTQVMSLRAGAVRKGMIYIVLGSMKPLGQGIRIPPNIVFPLDFDAYMNFTLTGHGTLILNSLSVLDAQGAATARFVLPRGHDPALAGLLLRHAYLAIDLSRLQVVFASNAAPLRLVK